MEAVQWFHAGDHPNVRTYSRDAEGKGWINTATGGYVVTPGDWIVWHTPGNEYIVKREIFEQDYELMEEQMGTSVPASLTAPTMSQHGIGWAMEQMQAGHRVCRMGWNGKDMFLFLVPGSKFIVNRPPLLGIYSEGTEIDYHPHVDMKLITGQIVPWVCSQSDLLATDWELAI